MTDKKYTGTIKGKIIELRFSSSGKLENVYKKRGDYVKRGSLIASFEKKQLQAELDKQLAGFEKVRADFEIYNLQKGEPKDDISKYLKSEKQSALNISVKEVELAKMKLDQADLFSPVEGVIIDDSGLIAGIYITPSSSPVKVLETASYYFEFEIEQNDYSIYLNPSRVNIVIVGIDKSYPGTTKTQVPSEKGKLIVEVKLDDLQGLFLGLKGEVNLV